MANHRHITSRLLLAARRGQVSYRRLAELLLERLAGLCTGCRRAAEEAAAEEVPLGAYREPVSRVVEGVEGEAGLACAEEAEELARQVPAAIARLAGKSPDQRRLLIENAPRRLGTPPVVEALLEEARACLPSDPWGSLGWAETAAAAVAACPEPLPAHRVLALALQGNALRAAGDFRRGRALLFEARDLAAEHGLADPGAEAELHSLLGSLATDERRFAAAAEHLETAAELYRVLEDSERLARTHMQRSILYRHLDALPAALAADREALSVLSPENDVHLYLAARINHAFNWAEAGDLQRARDELDLDYCRFQERADAHTRLRWSWLQARLAGALGDPEEGERGLLAVRDHFASERHGFNAALACLDLAALYHQEGWDEDLQEAAAHAVELFQAHALHREALAALVLVRDAAAARTLSAEEIHRAAAVLRKAALAPKARLGLVEK